MNTTINKVINNNKIEKVGVGYKLFEMNSDGKLFPLFIGKSEETLIGKWIHAENIPTHGFAARPGWHIGTEVPDAPWLKGYNYNNPDYGVYKSRFSKGKRVWCEVEYNATNNYDEEVDLLPKKCFEDKVPENGFYFFKEAGNRVWVITSDIRVTRILTEDERTQIMATNGYDEVGAFRKYKKALEKRMKIAI